MLERLNHFAKRWRRSRQDREPPSQVSPAEVEPTGARPHSAEDWRRELAALPAPQEPEAALSGFHRVIAVGSGKGGVGKTVVASSLALILPATELGPVTAVDVDLGGANLHSGLGIPRPSFALNRFLLDNVTLRKLAECCDTQGLSYIGGASDIVGLTEFSDEHRRRFLDELRAWSYGTTLLDLGAGSSLFNLDLFSLADQGILVTTPEPPAVQNAYGFLRAAVYRRIRLLFEGESGLLEIIDVAMNHRGTDANDTVSRLIERIGRYNRSAALDVEALVGQLQIGIVINMCDNGGGDKVAESFARLARRYLGVRLTLLGTVAWDETVRRAIREWRPLVVHYPKSKAARSLRTIANRVLHRFQCAETLTT